MWTYNSPNFINGNIFCCWFEPTVRHYFSCNNVHLLHKNYMTAWRSYDTKSKLTLQEYPKHSVSRVWIKGSVDITKHIPMRVFIYILAQIFRDEGHESVCTRHDAVPVNGWKCILCLIQNLPSAGYKGIWNSY